jgi:hypothetical protein
MIVKVANRNPLSEGEEAPIVVPMIVGENHVIEFVDPSQCEDLQNPIEVSFSRISCVDHEGLTLGGDIEGSLSPFDIDEVDVESLGSCRDGQAEESRKEHEDGTHANPPWNGGTRVDDGREMAKANSRVHFLQVFRSVGEGSADPWPSGVISLTIHSGAS